MVYHNNKLFNDKKFVENMIQSIGKLGITGIKCCTNQAIAYAKELYGVTLSFMYYYMKMMKSELISMGKGGTQKNILKILAYS